jgi:hypothetical protein
MKKIKVTIIIIVCFLSGFVIGISYILNQSSKFEYSRIGIKYSKIHKMWGKPSYVIVENQQFREIYRIPLINKFVFTYSQKDSVLISKWKER